MKHIENYCLLQSTEEALEWAGRIAAVTGATLLIEGAFSRLERGAGRPNMRRLPYFPQVGACH